MQCCAHRSRSPVIAPTLMPIAQDSGPPRLTRKVGNAISLERQLLLVMATVLTCILAASLVLTYNTLTSASRAQLRDRLRRAAFFIARTIQAGVATRNAELQTLAGDSTLHALLRVSMQRPAGASNSDALLSTAESLGSAQLVARTRQRLDHFVSTDPRRFPLEIWTAGGRRILRAGSDSVSPPLTNPSGNFPVRREGLQVLQLTDTVGSGDLFRYDDWMYYWTVVAVRDAGRTLGYVAQRVRVGGPESVDSWLRDLTGEDVTLHVRSGDARLWLGRGGSIVLPPVTRESTAAGIVLVRADGARFLSGESPVATTPWAVVLESPLRGLHDHAMGIVGRLALLSLILVVMGAVASHYMGRRITSPLASLTTAAEAITAGDYSRRVETTANDEVSRLANAFNTMALEVDRTKRELEQRVKDAQWSADELEHTNRQLLDSMVEAEHTRREAVEARAEAERANRAKSDFLAVMSHELRTPLNAIGGYAQLIELGIHGPVTDAQREALVRIARSQAHLLRLINDVLYFARIDASRVQYAMDNVPLEETLRAIEPLVAPQLRAKRLRFIYRPCATDLTVRADRDRLQQIVLNLLTNAIKYTPEGGHVGIESDEQDANICIRVRDTGVGIPADRLRSIFDPFVQVDRAPSRPNDGVGLGLAISRDLARGMGGELTVESSIGAGSVFIVVLARGGSHETNGREHAERGAVPHVE